MKLRLLDIDGDWVSANGNTIWTSFDDCQKDIKAAILNSELNTDYLPYKFVDADSFSTKKKMHVYGIVKGVDINLNITNLRVVPYSHRDTA